LAQAPEASNRSNSFVLQGASPGSIYLRVISKLTVIPKPKAEESAFLFDSKADSSLRSE
jgi:hypothetical protein